MPNGDYSLNFACPTCGAQPWEKCRLLSGTARFNSHIERWYIAKDYLRDTSFCEKGPLPVGMEGKAQD
jgi:hypothetical protein